MEKISTFKQVMDYIRCASIGDMIFRRSLMNFSTGGSTVDNYRNYLTHAGYLKTRRSGMYEYVKNIPIDISYKQLIQEAYPDSEWTK